MGRLRPRRHYFYPRYFEIFDASTAALFERALGMTKLQMLKTFDFAGFPLARTHARFLKPTRFGDDVTVETTVKFGRSSFEIEHRLSLNGETCVECSEKRVWVVRDAGRRPEVAPGAGRSAGEISRVVYRGASTRSPPRSSSKSG